MILGHKKQWELLKRTASAENLSHAYLFCGQEKLGKRTLALKWISSLLGQELQNGFHPDLLLVEPKGKEIQISQIRELIWKLSLKPYSAPLRTALIDQAHTMNQEAQTSLLKTLEEPRGRAVLILVSEYPEYLFPTILSRVETVKFYPVENKEIEKYLKLQNVPEELFKNISEISLGRPGRVVDLVSDFKKIDSFQEKIKELDKISNADLAFRFQYAKKLAEDLQGAKENLDIWLGYFRSALLKNVRGENGSCKHSSFKLKKILKLIQNTKYILSTTNVNPKLALEVLLMEI